jgi:hypothetical protein
MVGTSNKSVSEMAIDSMIFHFAKRKPGGGLQMMVDWPSWQRPGRQFYG